MDSGDRELDPESTAEQRPPAFNPADLARARAVIARLAELWGDEPPPEPALLGWDRED